MTLPGGHGEEAADVLSIFHITPRRKQSNCNYVDLAPANYKAASSGDWGRSAQAISTEMASKLCFYAENSIKLHFGCA